MNVIAAIHQTRVRIDPANLCFAGDHTGQTRTVSWFRLCAHFSFHSNELLRRNKLSLTVTVPQLHYGIVIEQFVEFLARLHLFQPT